MSRGTERPRTRRQIADSYVYNSRNSNTNDNTNTHRTLRVKSNRTLALAGPSGTALEFIPNSLVANEARFAIVTGAGFDCAGLAGKCTYPERSRVVCRLLQ